MKNIKIQIIGESGSGKSTIETLIKETLLLNGFDISNVTLNYDNYQERLERVKDNSFITVETVQVNRNSKDQLFKEVNL